jgi:hypothetical protein
MPTGSAPAPRSSWRRALRLMRPRKQAHGRNHGTFPTRSLPLHLGPVLRGLPTSSGVERTGSAQASCGICPRMLTTLAHERAPEVPLRDDREEVVARRCGFLLMFDCTICAAHNDGTSSQKGVRLRPEPARSIILWVSVRSRSDSEPGARLVRRMGTLPGVRCRALGRRREAEAFRPLFEWLHR